MSMSIVYGMGEDESGTATIHRALDMGVRLLDTADLYGGHANEVLVGKAIAARRNEVTLATQVGKPVILAKPRSRAAQNMQGLAAKISGKAPARKDESKSLFKRLVAARN